MSDYREFEEELEVLLAVAKVALSSILLSVDRTSKHAPYSWKNEDVNEHILKCIGHIVTGTAQYHEYKKMDGENHLHNAIVRLLMAEYLVSNGVEEPKISVFDLYREPCYIYYAETGKISTITPCTDDCLHKAQGGRYEDCKCGGCWKR